MFAKFAVALSTLAVLVAAGQPPSSVGQCNTGNAQCCNQVHQTGSTQANNLLRNLAAVDVGSLSGALGFQCNTITVIGGALGTNCAQQPVCCQGNTANGLVNIGCVPISL